MGSSTRKVMFHPNVIGKFEELAVLVAVPTRQPARLRRVQNQASGDAAHDVFGGDVSIVLLIPDSLHDLFEAVVGDAGLNTVTDELSSRQSPLLIWSMGTPGVHGGSNSLR